MVWKSWLQRSLPSIMTQTLALNAVLLGRGAPLKPAFAVLPLCHQFVIVFLSTHSCHSKHIGNTSLPKQMQIHLSAHSICLSTCQALSLPAGFTTSMGHTVHGRVAEKRLQRPSVGRFSPPPRTLRCGVMASRQGASHTLMTVWKASSASLNQTSRSL